MRVPRMSAGSKSGESCTRWNLAEIACDSVVAVSVLATPGTPSSRRWPQPERARPFETANGIAAKSAVSIRRISVCCPTMTFPISCSRPVTIAPAAWAFNSCCSIIRPPASPEPPTTAVGGGRSLEEPEPRPRRGRARQRRRVQVAVFGGRAPAHERALALLDLLERPREVAAGPRPQVAPAGVARELAQRRLLEAGPDDAPAFV